MKKPTWLLIVLVGAGLAYFEYVTHQPVTVQQAVEKRYVEVTLHASDAKKVTASFTRTGDAPGSFKLLIAAGTLILNADPGSQLLMVARPVTVALSADTPTVTADFETYCVNQFALEPTVNSSLTFTFNSASSDTSGVETEPIRKLAMDLADSGQFAYGESRNARQMALWMIAGGYQNMTRAAVYEKLLQGFRRTVEQQMTAGLDLARKNPGKTMPNLPEAEFEAALQRYRTRGWEEDRNAEAERLAKQALNDFVSNGTQVLKFHDPDIGDKPFFVDVRAKGLN